MKFEELNLDERILRAVEDMGFEEASPIQASAIPVIMDDRDVVGQALVLVEQILDDVVLLAGLDDPVDGHVLLQGVHHNLGVAGDGVELG